MDLSGPDCTLLAAPEGEAWCRAATEAAGSGPVVDPAGRFAATCGLPPAGAVLIRPDGVLAWRGDRPAPTARDEPHAVLAAILDRG